jgi:iron complex outermembrane receptor protein
MTLFSATVLGSVSANAADMDRDRIDTKVAQQKTPDGAAKSDAATATPGDTAFSDARRTPESAPVPLDGIVVVGSRLPAAEAQSAQDIHIYDRPRIERSGQTALSDFLATLPEVSLNSVESSNLSTTVRLRGAAQGTALILINGRRSQPVTGGAAFAGYFDLNMIPLSMVERIVDITTGSSAIYGGDALAGVVNIVMRSNFTGAEAGAGYKWAKNTDEQVYYAGAGWQSGDFNMTIMGSYSDRNSMSGKDREITNSPDYRRFGGPNLGTQFFGVPANVSSVSGNLPGVNSSFAAVPIGSSGIGLRPSDFAPTAGMQNTGSFTRYQSLVPDLHRSGLFATANYRFGSAFELFAEVLASRYKMGGVTTPPFLQLANVPASNPFNPFGTTVRVSGLVQGAETLSQVSFTEEFVRPLVGARGEIGTWTWELTGLTSRDRGSQNLYGQPNTAALNAALASSDPATALNPFVDGPMASPALLASIYSNASITSYKADSNIVDGFARGPLLEFPAGPLTAVLGAEYQKNTFDRGFNASQTDKALFAELRAPLLAGTDDRGGKREILAVQGAVRNDNYSDFGSQTTWQAGVELRPVESVLVRGTHATAFKPPTLYNLDSPRLFNTAGLPVSDPKRNGETVIVATTTGGNPELNPTTGTSSTAGFVWSPPQVRGLNMSMTWWRLRIDNAVTLVGPQTIVDNESLFPGRVVRAPASPGEVGQITSVDYSFINFGTMREDGIDASVDWKFVTGVGDFTPALAATYISKFEGNTTPGAPVVDRASHANNDTVFAPRWKGIASIAWNPGSAFKLWLAGRYIGRYTDYTPPRTIGNVWYLDATLEVGMEQALGMTKGSLGGLKLLVSGTNLTDKLPPYSTFFRGYDVFNYDLVGRTIFARLQVQM